MPPKEEIENEISLYTENLLTYCIDEFKKFKELEISQGEINVQTKIEDNEIILDTEWQLSITNDESISIIKYFQTEVLSRLGIIYNAARDIVSEGYNDGRICLTCISKIASGKDLKIDLTILEEPIIYTIKNENSENGQTFRFVFAEDD